jgi:CHAT domain
MTTKNDLDERFARAVALFNAGKLLQAEALFRAIAAGSDALAEKAKNYLSRIATLLARAQSITEPPKFKRRKSAKRAAKKPATLRFKKAAAPKFNQRKSAKRAAVKSEAAPKRAAKKREAAPKRAAKKPETAPKRGREFLPAEYSERRLSLRGRDIAARIETPENATVPPVPSGTASEIVTRTPHMDIGADLPLQPGSTFEVKIYADQSAPADGEDVSPIVVPADTRVDVYLVASDHFVIEGSDVGAMVINAEPRSDCPPFRVSVKPADKLPRGITPSLTALFLNAGRPCGMVRRAVSILDIEAPSAPPPPRPGQLEIVPPGIDVDLHVTVLDAGNRDGRTFKCTVRTPHLDAYREGVTETWPLPQRTDDLVRTYMTSFTDKNAPPDARIAALRGAGRLLFDATPQNFRNAFWQMIDERKPLNDFAIVSEEPNIPWELMVPSRRKDGKLQQLQPLGLQLRIGRWTTPDMLSPRQKLNLVDSFVVAPNYTDARKKLAHAQEEADFVAATFNGQMITPAAFVDVQRTLRDRRTLLHFVCHGNDSAVGMQAIDLENNQTLSSVALMGIDGVAEAFSTSTPIIFLNACQVGRLAPALVGVGGFAAAFIELGASAVIAPLWSVKDSIAHDIAMDFYGRVKAEPTTPFAEILRTIRGKAYDPANGEDTYAAYCFYGDPAAFAARS